MRLGMAIGVVLGGGLGVCLGVTGGLARAQEAEPRPAEAPAATVPDLILSIRGRALDMAPVTSSSGSLDLETLRAPTGAGTSRMPSASAEVAKGVYVSVSPVCIPGVDEPAFPPLVRRRPEGVRPR